MVTGNAERSSVDFIDGIILNRDLIVLPQGSLRSVNLLNNKMEYLLEVHRNPWLNGPRFARALTKPELSLLKLKWSNDGAEFEFNGVENADLLPCTADSGSIESLIGNHAMARLNWSNIKMIILEIHLIWNKVTLVFINRELLKNWTWFQNWVDH